MDNVTFLATRPDRGNARATGSVTGLEYIITSSGTPVRSEDVPGLLAVTGDPCCGYTLPFGGKVKLFGVTSASDVQVANVPDYVKNWNPPQKIVEKKVQPKKRVERKEDE